MTKQQILDEINSSSFQPEFEFTDSLDKAVDSILKPHEDYFLNLHDEVKEIIERETVFASTLPSFVSESSYGIDGKKGWEIQQELLSNYEITFANVCNWQKELFEYKKEKIKDFIEPDWQLDEYNDSDDPDDIKEWKDAAFRWNHCKKIINKLPNQHINLGLRQTNVKVGNWTPPNPMFLEELKEMCFPIEVDNGEFLTLPVNFDDGLINNSKVDDEYFKYWITEWYKVFETIHFFEDLNGRIGGIVINILSYCLTGKYLKHV